MTRIILLLLISMTCSFAGGRKGPKANISFHVESRGMENKKFTFQQMTAGQMISYRNIPVISTKDIVAYSPFPADDQTTYGLLLKLSKTARNRLTNISTANQGSWLLAQANGRVVDAVKIDRPVTDGQLVIWKSITAAELRFIDQRIPRVGENKKEWQKRIKEERKKQKKLQKFKKKTNN